ncbi:glycosyltransferase family 2 protein [Neiella sp. HB171785]|uniref:Glycosyltransferase family 2 protein n=1 Tax=Neiella litorisoli TaxID=2771431 RepID=A0A8J6QVI6_9GAMM|nr:glycosyltransferase family 2 protein [Neiella litorisoli]MBD1390553.1 glycosyltransferase family 2 protein [Neiella litorisoli]
MSEPIVSIIIPVYNDLNAIQQTLAKLEQQSCDQALFEILVVDNGSTDGSIEWLEQRSDVCLIKEHQRLASPYSCRNRGIEAASGRYIALLDSTCIPAKDWVSSAIKYLDEHPSCDLFGGQVMFNFEDRVTAGKVYDSVTNVQMEYAIKQRKAAKTANLWVRRNVFSNIGMFEEGVRSGEDMRWTGYCSEQGLLLEYCDSCTVFKYARSTSELLKKQIRVGKGQVRLWQEQGVFKAKFKQALKKVFPARRKTVRELAAKSKQVDCRGSLYLRFYLVAYFSGLATLAGNIIGCVSKQRD